MSTIGGRRGGNRRNPSAQRDASALHARIIRDGMTRRDHLLGDQLGRPGPAHYSYGDLARDIEERCGRAYNRVYLSKIGTGQFRSPDPVALRDIAAVLDLDPDLLLVAAGWAPEATQRAASEVYRLQAAREQWSLGAAGAGGDELEQRFNELLQVFKALLRRPGTPRPAEDGPPSGSPRPGGEPS